jgi:methylmalonyl-CoA mutase N-terminal domain/subunit
MRERFGATNPRAQQLRFHTQTAGSTLTAQQADNNIVRVAIQALAAVLGGTQSLHCNARDEALALPTEESARIALRTQQIIAHETGVPNTVDPCGGAFAIEELTDDIERGVEGLLAWIDGAGGTLAAIESGLIQREIQESAYRVQIATDTGESIVVGVNRFTGGRAEVASGNRSDIWDRTGSDGQHQTPGPEDELRNRFRVDPESEQEQVERLRRVRAARDRHAWRQALDEVSEAAQSAANLVPPIIAAVEARATVGEIADAMRAVFGEYREISTP